MKIDDPGLAPAPTPGWPVAHGYATERQWLDALAEREILRLRARYELSLDELRGLYISDRQVDALLRERGRRIVESDAAADPALRDPVRLLSAQAAQWRAHFARHSPLELLAVRWPLGPMELEIVALALAPELDLRYETLWAYLNNDIGRRHLTLDLAARLLGQGEPTPRAALSAALEALAQQGLLERIDPGEGRSRLAMGYRLTAMARAFLLGEPWPPPAQAYGVHAEAADPAVHDPRCGRVALVRHRWQWLAVMPGAPPQPPGRALLVSADEADARSWIVDHARATGRHLLWLNAAAVRALGPIELAGLARIGGALVALEPGPGVPEGAQTQATQAALAALLAAGIDVLVPQAPRAALPHELDGLDLAEIRPGDLMVDVADTTHAAGAAGTTGAVRAPKAPAFADAPALHRALPALDAPDTALARVAIRVQRRHDWSQLVLPPTTLALLREVAAAIGARERVYRDWRLAERSGRGHGLSVLLSGASGTGKTMAACVLAQHASAPLYRVDLAGVISKYIGETEKNLDRVFNAARGSRALLLFDEADALLGKRSEVKDAHDRYANLEVAYLLQRLEEHDGVVLLASNLAKNIDAAFARRLHYAVEFPRPEADLRERIWRGVLAPPTPCAPDVDCALLAQAFELTGGEIQTLALEAAFAAAARDAPIDQAGLLRVLRRQQTRQGKVARFGPAHDTVPLPPLD